MTNDLELFLLENMITLPKGIEKIRRFKDNKKWLSSNYKMSISSRGKNQTQTLSNVSISSFQIAKYPVTNQLYYEILDITGLDETKKLQPKVNISWIDSIRFCNNLSRYFGLTEYYSLDDDTTKVNCIPESKGFRLATDAEWQYASRAGSKSYQYSMIDEIAWHKGNSDNHLHKVGEKKPNNWKLFDMLGNCWEWCWDLYDQETYGSNRIFRGGSFAEEARICGSTTRRKTQPNFSIDDLGLRLARTVF